MRSQQPSLRAVMALAVVAVVLAVIGWFLIDRALTAPPQASRQAADPAPVAEEQPEQSPTAQPSRPEEAPVAGEGPRADAAIQKVMDRASRPDLSRGAERTLLRLGRQVLEADATGRGRGRWPGYFPAGAQGDHGYRKFRVQAAVARRDGGEHQAVVHLVWAGADRGGDYREGRVAAVRFINKSDDKGRKQWVPRR